MTEMQNNGNESGKLDNLEKYAMALGAGFLLFLVPVPTVVYSVLVLFIVTLILLYNKRKAYDPRTRERKALQALITVFWRFSYLSIVAFLVAASFLLAFGDSSALQEVQGKIEAGVIVSQVDMTAAMHQYQSENRMIIVIGNTLGFLPLVSYCVMRLKKIVEAYKAQEEIDPKIWR